MRPTWAALPPGFGNDAPGFGNTIAAMIAHPLKPVGDAQALAGEVRLSAGALLADALERVRQPRPAGADVAVHEARKRIKELRALLRLVAAALVDEQNQPVQPRMNEALRNAADALGEARDAAVMLQTLDGLVSKGGGAIAPEGALALRRELLRRQERHDARGGGFEAAGQILEAVRARVGTWRIAGDGQRETWRAIGPSLGRMYRRGRRAMRAAANTADAETWHAWRRRAKDLRYALELLRETAPPVLEGSIGIAKKLTDKLGEEHDLAVLMEFARGADSRMVSAATLAGLAEAVQRRGGELRCTAMRDGEWLYAEERRAFELRIGAYWRAAVCADTAANPDRARVAS